MSTPSLRFFLILALVAGLALTGPVQAESFLDALANGKPMLQFVLGYEHSDVKDNGSDAANSLTLRTRLGYESGEFAKTKLTLQLQNVVAIVDDYAPEQPGYDVVADPEGSAVHEAYLTTMLTEDMLFKLGRQEIILHDARLIGNVGWRQHAQSFDALTFAASGGGFKFVGSYVTRAKTIFNTLADLEYLGVLDFTYSGIDGHEFAAFAYLLDAEGDLALDRDKATYGLSAKGAFGPVEYSADYVTQDDWADAELGGGDMFNAFLAGKVPGGLKLGAGYSSISGASGGDRPFDTLFSTAHKFNGWADQFLATNGGKLVAGLDDMYFQAGGVWGGHTLLARYHVFDKEATSGSYGDEIDLLWKKKVHPRVVALVKAAFYSADGDNLAGVGSKDETVFWVRGIYSF